MALPKRPALVMCKESRRSCRYQFTSRSERVLKPAPQRKQTILSCTGARSSSSGACRMRCSSAQLCAIVAPSATVPWTLSVNQVQGAKAAREVGAEIAGPEHRACLPAQQREGAPPLSLPVGGALSRSRFASGPRRRGSGDSRALLSLPPTKMPRGSSPPFTLRTRPHGASCGEMSSSPQLRCTRLRGRLNRL
jgi:hypothetical protein